MQNMLMKFMLRFFPNERKNKYEIAKKKAARLLNRF